MGITCDMVRPHGALHVLALVNNGARLSEMAIPCPQHKVQEEVDLTPYWPETENNFEGGLMNEIVAGIIRHALTALNGVLVGAGYI